MKGRQKSDERVVPEGRRKTVSSGESRGGKAFTVEEATEQLALFVETAENPQGALSQLVVGEPRAKEERAPKSTSGQRKALSPMNMESIAAEGNLRMALSKVVANRGAAGPDRVSVNEVRERWEEYLRRIRSSLLEGSYRAGEIRRVWIPKKSGGRRGLGIPNVIDRIVQQATHQVLSPHYEGVFHEWSHGFRTGRGCHTALKQAKEHLEAGGEWVVDIDLSKFFDRVNHDRLMHRLSQRIGDKRVLTMIRGMLRAKIVMPNGVVQESREGTPQGGPLSPLLSNIVLDELDKELARRGHRFVRYADDCNVYVKTERAGHRVMASLRDYIERKMKLRVNQDKSKVARPQERKFLGITLRKRKSGQVSLVVSRDSMKALRAKLKELTPRNWGSSLDSCIARLNRYMRGWLGYFAIAGRECLGHEDAHVRRRLRAIQLRQWKKKRLIVRHLIALGSPVALAEGIYGGHRSWWAMSMLKGVTWALRNSYYEERGLFLLKTSWNKTHGRIWDIGPEQQRLPLG